MNEIQSRRPELLETPNNNVADNSAVADKVKVIDHQMLENLSNRARRSVLRTITASPKFSSAVSNIEALPRLDRDELCLGRLLGTGQFGIVYEIKKFNLKGTAAPTKAGIFRDGTTRESKYNEAENRVSFQSQSQDGREFLAKYCLRSIQGKASPRYAIKSLQSKYLKRPSLFYLGVKDLAKEALFLSTLVHPHIVKLRGTAAAEMCSENYFIVLDRLYGTLKDQIKEWKRREKKYSVRKRFLMVNRTETKLEEMFEERLSIAFDISAAIKYLHSSNLLHRDLKPANIGFDVRGDVKIFDFGLAVEIPSNRRGPYKLTGNTGTMCYMAPEVYYCKLYDQRCDVHSFGLLLWEIFALEKVYDLFDVDTFIQIAFEEGIRPPLIPEWPEELKNIMSKCTVPDFVNRPFMAEIWGDLRMELARIRKVDPEVFDDDRRRRSTFVFRHLEGISESLEA